MMLVSTFMIVYNRITGGQLCLSGCHSKSDWWVISKNWSQPAWVSNVSQREGEWEWEQLERICNRFHSLPQIAADFEILYQGSACNLHTHTFMRHTRPCKHTCMCTLKHKWVWQWWCWQRSLQRPIPLTWPALEHCEPIYNKQTKGNFDTHRYNKDTSVNLKTSLLFFENFDWIKLCHTKTWDKRLAGWVSDLTVMLCGSQQGLCFQQNNSSAQTWQLFQAAGGVPNIYQKPVALSVNFQAHGMVQYVQYQHSHMHTLRLIQLSTHICTCINTCICKTHQTHTETTHAWT